MAPKENSWPARLALDDPHHLALDVHEVEPLDHPAGEPSVCETAGERLRLWSGTAPATVRRRLIRRTPQLNPSTSSKKLDAPNGIRTHAATLKASIGEASCRRGKPVCAGGRLDRVLIVAGRWVLFGARMGPE